MTTQPAGEVFLSPVDSQMVPVRLGEPLWPGPGFHVWEQQAGQIRRLVGFIPEAAAAEIVTDYESRDFHVSFAGALQVA